MPRMPFTASATHTALMDHHARACQWRMADLFAQDPLRAQAFSLEAAGLFLDYSKNRIDRTTVALLVALARECGVAQQRDAMFAGARINTTENRAVLHTALRAPRGHTLRLDGRDINADVHAVLDQMRLFSDQVRTGAWRGCQGQAMTDIVNIGIGGSDLGPKMACQALRPYGHPRLTSHFISNADGNDLAALLPRLNPATTLFIIASKTFTTAETMMNAQTARTWFLRQHPHTGDLKKHFVAVSTNTPAVQAFGIAPENMFPFWDWVGGRYSLWSAIGLSIMLAIGFDHFAQLLAGAHALDRHFQEAPLERNLPVLLALIGIWNRNYFQDASLSIAPYHQDLKYFPAYLQQLEMESNGKQVACDGTPLAAPACPVIWGNVGTNGQHAYFQLLHQGADVVPVDFITALQPAHDLPGHHTALLANCFAQSEALMLGKNAGQASAEMQAEGNSAPAIAALLPHKLFPGNRPSNTLLLETLSPARLGALIALYEHKTFVQGVIWGINSFDQWGVELGKVLAKQIHAELAGAAVSNQHDSSTHGLIARARAATLQEKALPDGASRSRSSISP
ncbi:glucose-6-phosphate isomerase [Noviherbaspirillum sedimenti]|uniref:Glucose-6-phosphate isomerase n=1 Tax=Noviherbaspirillum sedimenti TaxID=2320865 RepID=A0A3A3G226_9BURK|nr:glucose-6-phosphate isomerase [Noviherbaspirillum sedimenti]RJG01705.1 glucose-6-phosphate isomerase [Noviherbaspirillum sedimenti]